jgi:hypothetical protein
MPVRGVEFFISGTAFQILRGLFLASLETVLQICEALDTKLEMILSEGESKETLEGNGGSVFGR